MRFRALKILTISQDFLFSQEGFSAAAADAAAQNPFH